MDSYYLTRPTAGISKVIEEIVIYGKNSDSYAVFGACAALSRLISVTVFPVFLFLELTFKRVPKLLLAIGDSSKFEKKLDKLTKFALGIICSPLGVHSPEGVSGLFLKHNFQNTVAPFGVEKLFGKEVSAIVYPSTIEELQQIVKKAKEEKKQISIIGAGMSQGTQTVPLAEKSVVIDLRKFKQMEISADGNTLNVQAGANWEEVQIYLNSQGKSAIVKQASDIFTIGGSIGINCHGWAHEDGSISSTVEELQIINADGELETVTKEDEKFGIYFGTLGYFGIIVSAKLKVTNNCHMIEETQEIPVSDFHRYYQENIKGKGIPLLGGRLVLDSLESNPLNGRACLVTYKEDQEKMRGQEGAVVTPHFHQEPTWGTRIERIGLRLFAHLSNFSVRYFTSWFWNREKESMLKGRKLTRNEALHPPINAFKTLHHSNLHTQWLQEYFIKGENLANFLAYLGAELKAEGVRLVNATIRPTPKDEISILPYAEQDRYAVVICFSQEKSDAAIQKTKNWIQRVNEYVLREKDVYYQAYMPYTTKEQFVQCYGQERLEQLQEKKRLYDPEHVFGNAHTAKYFDEVEGE
jgi:FAD/FMN-containing dehydrogenase